MRNVFRIDAIEAGKAHIFLLDAGDRLCKPFQGKVVQGICADHGADLFCRILRCDQLLSFRGIDTEEAGILDWRRADTELDLLGAGVPQKVNDDAARRAADDGVIDQYDAFPFDIHADRVQLHADSAFTLFLPRLDEGTAHVLILEQPFYEGDAGSSGIAKSSDIAAKIKKGEVGGLFNLKGVEKIREVQKQAVEGSRLGIPLLFGMDVIHGYETMFPIPLGLSCTWDMTAIEESARIAAVEASADGISWTFSPMVDITRDPR